MFPDNTIDVLNLVPHVLLAAMHALKLVPHVWLEVCVSAIAVMSNASALKQCSAASCAILQHLYKLLGISPLYKLLGIYPLCMLLGTYPLYTPSPVTPPPFSQRRKLQVQTCVYYSNRKTQAHTQAVNTEGGATTRTIWRARAGNGRSSPPPETDGGSYAAKRLPTHARRSRRTLEKSLS